MKIRIDHIPNPVIVYNTSLIIKHVNRAAMEMLGYDSPESLTDKKIHHILAEKDHPEISDISQLAKAGKPYHPWNELCHITQSKKCVYVLAHFSVIPAAKEQNELMIIETCIPTGNTFNHLHRQVEKLHHHTTLAENVPGLEMVLVNSGYIIINSMGSELQNQGWAGPEPEGKHLFEHCTRNIAGILKPLLKIAFEFTPVSREFKIANKQYSVRLVPLITDSAEQACVIVFQNITETKLIEEKLKLSKIEAEEANAARGNFIAKMSHEIRTPLNAIIGFSEQLKKTSLNEKQQHFMEVVHNSSKHLLSIIDEILVISKIDSEEIQVDEIPFTIPDIMKSVNNVVEYKYRAKKLDYRNSVDLKLTDQVLIGDPAKLRQVLINLVNNAIKFTHEGSVEVRCSALHETEKYLDVDFEIRDTGIGIIKEDIKRIFKPFHQVDESVGRTYSGTGLGLTISKELIEKQGGELKVESFVGDGSAFTFSLRFAKTSLKPEADHKHEFQRKKLPNNLRILFVDDDDMNRMLGKAILHELEIRTDFTASGHEAMRLFQPGKYQLVLLDINMPGFDGVEVARRMRHEEQKAGLKQKSKIIAMTANVFKRHIKKYLDVGMDDVILKPFSEEDILEKIGKHSLSISETELKEDIIEKANKNNPKKDYDLEQIERITKGDETFLLTMLRTFVENTQSQLHRIEHAYAQDDYPEIAEAAHRLLPSVEQFGMKKMSKLLKKIEEKYLRKRTYNPDSQLIENAMKEIKSGIRLIQEAISGKLNQK